MPGRSGHLAEGLEDLNEGGMPGRVCTGEENIRAEHQESITESSLQWPEGCQGGDTAYLGSHTLWRDWLEGGDPPQLWVPPDLAPDWRERRGRRVGLLKADHSLTVMRPEDIPVPPPHTVIWLQWRPPVLTLILQRIRKCKP